MQRKFSVLGTGLICLDIINYKENQLFSNGGTCANVLSVLAQIGWEASVLKPQYDDPWDDFLEFNFNALGVSVIHDRFVRKSCPRIIEELGDKNHIFHTVCPECNKKILNLPRLGINQIEKLKIDFNNIDVFYHDRVSDGIREIVKIMHQKEKLVFYEPNGGRNPVLLVQDAINADIVKFSKNNISMKIADEIRTKANEGRTKVIIITDGNNGLLFSYLATGDKMSEWETVEPFESDQVVDTSGAGDWLSAGFIDHLMASGDISNGHLKKDILVNSIKYGIEYSKLCCETIGAQGVFYSEQSMMQFNRISNRISYGPVTEKPLLALQINDYADICKKCLLSIE